MQDAAQAILATAPTVADYDVDAAFWRPPYHTQERIDGQSFGIAYIQDQIPKAKSRLHGFRMQHWLKECLQCPASVYTRRLLEEGLLQKTFAHRAERVSKFLRVCFRCVDFGATEAN